jgi:hypothetical protein
MGKVRRQQIMLQCFALAIWWSYLLKPVIERELTSLGIKILSDAINVENGLSMIPVIGVRLSNAYL